MKFFGENRREYALGRIAGFCHYYGSLSPFQARHVTCRPWSSAITSRIFLTLTLRMRNVVAVYSRMTPNGPMIPRTIRWGLFPSRATLSAHRGI